MNIKNLQNVLYKNNIYISSAGAIRKTTEQKGRIFPTPKKTNRHSKKKKRTSITNLSSKVSKMRNKTNKFPMLSSPFMVVDGLSFHPEHRICESGKLAQV